MKRLALITLLISFVFASCSWLEDSDVLPASGGKTGELIVLIETDLWKSDLQDSLIKYLGYSLPGLPTEEAAFRLISIPKSAFGRMLKTHRNVLAVQIGNDQGLKKSSEIFSDIQLFLKLEASSINGLRTQISSKGNQIAAMFMREEIIREQTRYKMIALEGFENKLKTEQGVKLSIPKDYYEAGTASENVYHLKKEMPKATLGILISVTPYVSENQFNLDGLVADRNQVAKPNLPGQRSGAYMSTETLAPIEIERISEFDTHAIRARGLWKMKNDFMGGPFIQYRVLSRDGSKIITLDGYVFGPGFRKRNLILELEAIFNSLELI